MKNHTVRTVAALIALAAAGSATAATTRTTLPFANGTIASFGEPDTATYGQTITVPGTDYLLHSFSFWLDDWSNPGPIDFAAYVMAWDGSKATGGILYESAPQTTGGLTGFEQFTFDAGNLALTPGAQYVLFLSASNFFDLSEGTGGAAVGSTPYADGGFVYMNNGSDFSLLTTQDWIPIPDLDLAFEATFVSVPAPAAVLLAAFGTGASVWLRRRRVL